MGIGQNTFWIIVAICDGEALTEPADQRRAIRFVSEESAQNYFNKEKLDKAFYMVVRVPG